MSEILACRIEVSARDPSDLDVDLLVWLADHVEPYETEASGELWKRHSFGLVGNMTGMLRLLADLFPGATWGVAPGPWGVRGEAHRAWVLPAGSAAPFAGASDDAANALGAAIVRAHAAAKAKRMLPAAE